jgi:hypothetical protein
MIAFELRALSERHGVSCQIVAPQDRLEHLDMAGLCLGALLEFLQPAALCLTDPKQLAPSLQWHCQQAVGLFHTGTSTMQDVLQNAQQAFGDHLVHCTTYVVHLAASHPYRFFLTFAVASIILVSRRVPAF